jgi:hypothetical protein
MTENQQEDSGRKRWLKGLAAAGWTFSVIMGTAGLGLMAGLAYGACVASQTPRTSPTDDIFISTVRERAKTPAFLDNAAPVRPGVTAVASWNAPSS